MSSAGLTESVYMVVATGYALAHVSCHGGQKALKPTFKRLL